MIQKNDITAFLHNHVTPYAYNNLEFIPGKTSIYYSGPYWDIEEISSAINTFLNGKWITSGEKVNEFEIEFSKKFNVKYSQMVNSGSSANLILIAGLKKYFKWEDKDEIIVSPVGFPTTISVIYQNNLMPVFVDIEWNTLNFNINEIEEKITKKTKGIFVSPVLGNPPDFDKLLEICKKHGLILIGDNCDSLGSKWDGKFLNEYYTAFTSSFYPAHHISTGEGGMVSTNIKELNDIFNRLSWWGRDCHCIGSANLMTCGMCNNRFGNWLKNYNGIIDHKYVFTEMGYNLKPLDLQGAIGLAQLKKFDEIDRKRKNSKQTIETIFTNKIKEIHSPKVLIKSDPCWFGTPFICDKIGLKHKLVEFLEENKIQTRNYFAGNILLHPGYEFIDDYRKYPESNKILDTVFFIGAAPHYNDNVFQYIQDVINKF